MKGCCCLVSGQHFLFKYIPKIEWDHQDNLVDMNGLTYCSLLLTAMQWPRACEEVDSDLGLDGFPHVLQCPPPLTTGLLFLIIAEKVSITEQIPNSKLMSLIGQVYVSYTLNLVCVCLCVNLS